MDGFLLLVPVVAVVFAVVCAVVASSYELSVVVVAAVALAVFAPILVQDFDYQKLQHEPLQVFLEILQVLTVERILGKHYLLQPKKLK